LIKIEKTDVYGWETDIRGMRNPMNSWDKSDSKFHFFEGAGNFITEIGENDLKLMKSLAKAGSDHGKFLRMITVTCDITAPLYWWKEFDTYKVGTVANSCSTMHKIQAKPFTLDDFSHEHLDWKSTKALELVIACLNINRVEFIDYNEKVSWWQMIQLLPSSYNQKRTVQLNYEVLRAIDRPGRRRDHKLDEWREFCKWAETLPYFKEIVLDDSCG
jgi:hypothetical protein